MTYRCVATSVQGFLQQLAVSYVGRGYWFYVTGEIPSRKDPRATDQKIIEQYNLNISVWARARRKKAGYTNIHYLRFERFFVILATEGHEQFMQAEQRHKDVRRDSIRFRDYCIGYKRDRRGKWHPSVRIHPRPYMDAKCWFLEVAARHLTEAVMKEFRALKWVPFAPVRGQILVIFRAANERLERRGLVPVPRSALRLTMRSCRVFGEPMPPELRQGTLLERGGDNESE